MVNGQATPIEVSLQLTTATDGGVDAVLTFTNRSSQPYHLLKWLTFPTGRIDAKRFEVTVDDKPAVYTGMLKKRGEPGPDDWGLLQPGYYVSSTVNLSEAYDMPPGKRVAVTYVSMNPPYGARTHGDRLRSNTVQFVR